MPIDPDYKPVSIRLADLKAKHPEGCVRLYDPSVPYRVERIDDKTFIVVVAACYRTPDDAMPGIGMAWEPFPGPTNFTRDSELQNAETSAWGRAIVAALASESKNIASAEDVRNRNADPLPRVVPFDLAAFKGACERDGLDPLDVVGHAAIGKQSLGDLTQEDRPALLASLKELVLAAHEAESAAEVPA